MILFFCHIFYFSDTDASGSLFFEFYRILQTLRMRGHRMFWLFENTAAMPCSMKAIINR
jgi:hypothetical protein